MSDAVVTATGGPQGAGIGGGFQGSGGTIDIASGEVIAIGGTFAAGIGGGHDSIGIPGLISISDAADVVAISDGARPAIDAIGDQNGSATPANIVNAGLDTPISTTANTTLKVYQADGVTPARANVTLPANYSSFAFTTGAYAGECSIEAWDTTDATELGNIVKADDAGNVVAGPSLAVVPVKLIPAVDAKSDMIAS